MTPDRIKQYSGVVDLVLILSSAMTARLPFMALALLLMGARRWPLFCRGVLGHAPVTPWVMVFLPGAASSEPSNPAPVEATANPIQQFVPAPKEIADTLNPLVNEPLPMSSASMMSTEQWRDALNESKHLFIYGPSNAGKTTLAQAVVAMFGACDYMVIDPMPNKPGERKWGGIDFVTLDDTGADEYASIKRALSAIEHEDDRRRALMRTVEHGPLVIIIDEVLFLVDALGMITNDEGKKEPRMSHFIRKKGYSSRHRNIKIILIGQGKNLKDLGLDSSTARNNYVPVRVARNSVTNERTAYLEADGVERQIDTQYIPRLASATNNRARVWLTHEQAARAGGNPDEVIARLLGQDTTQAADDEPIDQAIVASLRILRAKNISRDEARALGFKFRNGEWTAASPSPNMPES